MSTTQPAPVVQLDARTALDRTRDAVVSLTTTLANHPELCAWLVTIEATDEPFAVVLERLAQSIEWAAQDSVRVEAALVDYMQGKGKR